MATTTLDDKGIIAICSNCGQKNRIPFDRLGTTTARCGKCQTTLPPLDRPVEAPGADLFDVLIAQSPLPVVVDFWAPWCGPCRMVAPELEKVAGTRRGQWIIAKVNTDEVPALGDRYRVRSIPTMAVFSGGREIARTAGARPAGDIEAFVSQALLTAAADR
jgi:thioredoxin 2